MQFISSDKRLQELFFQNHPPLPPQELNGRPLIKLSYNTSSVEAVYSQVFFYIKTVKPLLSGHLQDLPRVPANRGCENCTMFVNDQHSTVTLYYDKVACC